MAPQTPDRFPASWWDEESFLYGMRAALSPALLAYVQEVLLGRFKIEPKGKRLLDLGCGGGWLAEEMRRIGFRTTGLDASAEAIAAATRHAEESALDVDYHLARGEDIPFADDAFDVVLLCGVLEQVAEIDAVLAEVARVLKKGGVLLFSAFNRTERSRAMVSLLERREWTRAAPPGSFDWSLFVDPEGLRQALHRRGVERRELVGLAPRAGPLGVLGALHARRLGRLSYAELGARLAFRPAKDARLAYMGHAIKLAG